MVCLHSISFLSWSFVASVFLSDPTLAQFKETYGPPGYLLQWVSSGTGNVRFDNPAGLAVDTLGSVYVVDTDNHRIQKFDSAGNFLPIR